MLNCQSLHVASDGVGESIPGPGIRIALYQLLLCQWPRSVSEPLGETSQFHVPGWPSQVLSYAVFILWGDCVGIEYDILDFCP